MFKKITALITAIAFFVSGCASIVSNSQYPVSISSSPDGAKFTVTNSKGQKIHSGTTPSSISLDAGNGWFKKASYLVEFTKPGYDSKTYELKSSIDGWYFGNILLGFVGIGLGALIIDPLSGAMYKLPDVATVSLDKNGKSSSNSLNIISLDDLTYEQQARLIRIN